MASFLPIVFSWTHLLVLLRQFGFGIAVAIPSPNGTYGVNLSTMKLTDTARLNPFASTPKYRSVMISLFYPAALTNNCQPHLAKYMPRATAAFEDQAYSQYGVPNGTFESLELSLCSGTQMAHVQGFPLVLFSPGLGDSRLLYNAMAQSVTSYGYIVVTIDHPYDANIVEYPDGTLVFAANISTEAQIDKEVQIRAEDVRFVLDQLGSPSTVHTLLYPVITSLKTDKVPMFGHSLGGATMATAMMNDPRIIGGVNLDGTFFGSVIDQGLGDPFLLFGHEGKNQSTDSTWADIWPHLGGWKLELMLDGAQHATFTDLPLLLEVLDLTGKLPPDVAGLVGTLPGTRALEVITAYLVAFFDLVSGGRPSALLQRPNTMYPEVHFVADRN
ncbi:hypothetical protein MMC18_001347 [Xylographa bjoerkii]|nr:hypothetical protein [Xylographa bjoerkii]